MIARTDLSTADRVTGYCLDMSQIFVKSGFQTACLTGKFSTEVAATSDVFRPLTTVCATIKELIEPTN